LTFCLSIIITKYTGLYDYKCSAIVCHGWLVRPVNCGQIDGEIEISGLVWATHIVCNIIIKQTLTRHMSVIKMTNLRLKVPIRGKLGSPTLGVLSPFRVFLPWPDPKLLAI